ncbi:hypothetical protein ACI79R_18000 [Blastococcus sp. SYSU D00820]
MLALGFPLPAAAEDPTGAAAPQTQCQITDPRLGEISGLVAGTGGAVLVMNDGGGQVEVYALDAGCQVVDVHTAAVDPYDPEDLAVAADGTVWIADTGDNRGNRSTVALIALRPDGSAGVHRLTYPDGPHDAEALLLAPDGTPYVVTKEFLGASGVYRPVSSLVENGVVGLERVGTVELMLTGTAGGPVGRAGQLMVTGGAVSADGRWVALRTYTDAYVWPLSGSDVAAALATDPVRVALPPSPQGEAISVAPDGRLVVASEGLPSDLVLVPVPAADSPAAAPGDDSLADALAGSESGVNPLPAALTAAAVAGLLVWLGGKLRRRKVE